MTEEKAVSVGCLNKSHEVGLPSMLATIEQLAFRRSLMCRTPLGGAFYTAIVSYYHTRLWLSQLVEGQQQYHIRGK